MARPKGSKNKKRISKLSILLDTEKPIPKVEEMLEPEPEAKKPEPGSILVKGKRSTKMMYEVLPWAKMAKYYELVAAVTE